MVSRDSPELVEPAHACGLAKEDEWIFGDAWDEGISRSSSFGPSDSFVGAGTRARRHDRGRAGARLSDQSAAQFAARAGARDRRERAAGAVRLPSQGI